MLRRPPKSTRTDTLFPYTALFRSSSSINGMAYVRGHARDYDRWVQGGLAGWDYSQVLPYFRKAETYERGADAYRGGDGPLQVSAGACRNPLFKAWIEAEIGRASCRERVCQYV